MHTLNGYEYTRHADGSITVHGVPIFAECFRKDPKFPDFDGRFDADWIRSAVTVAKMRHSEGYEGPMHLRHHEKTATGDAADEAGTFRITAVSTIRNDGRLKLAVTADLHFTDQKAVKDAIAGKFPHRSVEIHNPGSGAPEFDSLALLATEVPFLRLPNLKLGEMTDESGMRGGVPVGTLTASLDDTPSEFSDCMVGWQRPDGVNALLFRDEPMTKTATAPKTLATFGAGVDKATTATIFADDGKPKDDKGGDKDKDSTDLQDDGSGVDVKAIAKMITDGSISLADMEMLEAAIRERQAGAIDSETNPQPAPAAVPAGGEAMAADNSQTVQMAAQAAEIVTMKSDILGMQSTARREKDVAEAVDRLKNRDILGNIEKELDDYHREHGPLAFAAFRDALCKHNAVIKDDGDVTTMASASETAMKFSDEGTARVQEAAKFEEQGKWLVANQPGCVFTAEEFVQIRMAETAPTGA